MAARDAIGDHRHYHGQRDVDRQGRPDRPPHRRTGHAFATVPPALARYFVPHDPQAADAGGFEPDASFPPHSHIHPVTRPGLPTTSAPPGPSLVTRAPGPT